MRIALLASCTIELLQFPLARALETRGVRAEFWVAGFGQYRQALLDPHSALYRFQPEAVILYLDGEDLFGELLENPFAFPDDNGKALAEQALAELHQLVGCLRQQASQTTLLLNTVSLPPLNTLLGLEYNAGYAVRSVGECYNEGLKKLARNDTATRIVDVAAGQNWLGHARWSDARLWYLARSRWSRDAAQWLARRYTATLCSEQRQVRKCVVLDLDNVLWGGIVGEDGPERIQLGPDGIGRAYCEFQGELLNLYRKGVLLAICSKNNPEDALAVIRQHVHMRLREQHFAAMRINWEDKASNLRALAEEMNIGLDSLAFIDDNPVERAWVRQALLEVLVPEWPSDPSDYKTALLELELDHFEKLSLTTEDRRRGEEYAAQAQRRSLASGAASLKDFYHSLQMRVTIGLANGATLPRIAQLTQKTNQFNLTTRRYAEAEVAALAASPQTRVFWLELSDRFGNSGVVGVMILRQSEAEAWLVDTFLLSCRVMGRTVENVFLGFVQKYLRQEGARRMIGEYRPTPKSAPVADLYPRLGFRAAPQGDQEHRWEMDLEQKQVEIPEWFEIVTSPGDGDGR